MKDLIDYLTSFADPESDSFAEILKKTTLSPLHVAVFLRRRDWAQQLLNEEPDLVRAVTQDTVFKGFEQECSFYITAKVTPLHVAALIGDQDMCHLLIEKGASLCAKDADWLCPLDYVPEDRLSEFSGLLRPGPDYTRERISEDERRAMVLARQFIAQNYSEEPEVSPKTVDPIFFGEVANTKTQSGSGLIREIKTINQFDSSIFGTLVSTYGVSPAICGYVSTATALMLSGWWRLNMTVEEIDKVTKLLRDPTVMLGPIQKCMAFIHESRLRYISAHESDFDSKTRESYIRDWVANYEISDYLKSAQPSSSEPEPGCSEISFFRAVGYGTPDGNKTQHEEKARLVEEIPFEHQDYFVDCINAGFFSLSTWSSEHRKVCTAEGKAPVFVVDVSGHFIVGAPCICDGVNTLVLFDSYVDVLNYKKKANEALCDLFFQSTEQVN